MGGCCSRYDNTKETYETVDGTERMDRSSSASSGYARGPLTLKDITARITAPDKTKKICLSQINLHFAYVSQRGYYPDDLHKPNQDSFLCIPEFAGDPNKAFFCVFDGHGSLGDICARFAADTLPVNIEAALKEESTISEALKKAHILTNQQMHDAPFDDSLSGTTAISVLFVGNEIHVSNIGDSRAIIAQEKVDGEIKAKPLSIDQTPFRVDERERVKKFGARIMTVDQLEGVEPIHENWGLDLGEEIDESGDPPRIWHPNGDYPGTAFTRSFGDRVSEELGVFAEPEILTKKLNTDDRFIVIASDGVFEFLTSQSVVDMVKEHDDPLQASRSVVEESYSRWLQYEIRTDDITMICIKIDGITDQRDKHRSSIIQGAEMLDMIKMQKPVRGSGVYEHKRDTILGTDDVDISIDDVDFKLVSKLEKNHFKDDSSYKKTESEENMLKDSIQKNVLFRNLDNVKIKAIVDGMFKQEMKAGDIIIKQNEPGRNYYIVGEGELEVRVKKDSSIGNSSNPKDYGDVVYTYRTNGCLHPSFGDLALMYSKPRAATVIAISSGFIWGLDRVVFRSILTNKPKKAIVKMLRDVNLLSLLTAPQMHKVAEQMHEEVYEPNQIIVAEGAVEDTFYLILDGEVKVVTKNEETGEINEIERKIPNSFFGERALIENQKRKSSVIAVEETTCIHISREAFEAAVGSLSKILETQSSNQKKLKILADSRKNVPMGTFIIMSDKMGDLIPMEDISPLAMISKSATDTLRLVQAQKSSVFMTLRTYTKNKILQAGLQHRIANEYSNYASFTTPSSIVLPIHALSVTETDIHALFEDIVVDTFSSFLDSKPQTEEIAQFYIGQAILALEYLHREGIVCRALDPSQLLLNCKGHLRIISLRLSKHVSTGRAYTLCGTTEFLSPEEVHGQGHGMESDLWGLGVLLYELLTGFTPFKSNEKENDEMRVFNQITTFNSNDLVFDSHIGENAKDLVKKLLVVNPNNRIGITKLGNTNTVKTDLREHPFFKSIDWHNLEHHRTHAPFESKASAKFKDILHGETLDSKLDLGEAYNGDTSWLNVF